MNRRNGVIVGAVGIGAVLLGATYIIDRPNQTAHVRLDRQLAVSVHKYEDENITDVEIEYKKWIMDINNDNRPDFRRARCGPHNLEIYDFPLHEGDRELFNEAVTKAGLKK